MASRQQDSVQASQAAQHRGVLVVVIAWFGIWAKACLDAWEEGLIGLLRESLAITQRAINGASAWTLSVFNRGYKAQLRGRWTVLQEQYSWWGQGEPDRRSTLNAVLARKYDEDDTAAASAAAAAGTASSAAAAAAPAGAFVSQDGRRLRKPPASSSQAQPQQAPLHPTAPHSTPAGQPAAGMSEIEPLPEDSPQQRPGAQTRQRMQQQQRPAGAADAADPGAQQWWDTPATWLSEMADEATEAAAAAQEAASAAVQQAASSMSHAVEEAAATAASWARSMRAVFVEPPAGWGVHEAIKQTGLLEDVSIHGQLLISRIFDKLRWLLSKVTFSAVAQTPTAARQRATSLGSRFSGSSTADNTPAAAGGTRQGFFERLRSSKHPAAAGAGAAGGGSATASWRRGVAAGGRWKLRSVTSLDLPNTRRLSLEADEDSDDQQRSATDESGFSDTSTDAYDDAVDDGSSEASCSSTSSWAQQQHGSESALAAAGTASSAAMATSAAADYSDLPGPPLTVRVPHSALNGGSGSGSSGRGGNGKVSFAAERQRGTEAAAAATAGAHSDPTPFATVAVQQQHQADMNTQPALGGVSSSSSSSGKVGAAGKSSSKGSSSRQRQRIPEGLGAVLPGRGKRRLQRSHSGPAVSVLRDVSSAGQVIRMAGYPLEVHEVVTHDGYLLRMERIPQHAATDAVFMMHGVLDTSLTWVAGGITGSQAFAAWDRGFDVWLGTSRCNPPHEAADPARRGSAYWVYSHNEVGMYDMGAQMDHIHAVKMRELTALGRTPSNSSSRRASASDSATAAARAGRRPSGRRSSGSAAHSRRAIPEHVDVLEGVVDADALVGIQHVTVGHAGDAAAVGGKQGLAADAAPSGCGVSSPHAGSEAHRVSPAPGAPVRHDSLSAGLRPQAGDMARAQSAAEIDQAAAAEAAEAFSRHRAALAAAGISPAAGASSLPEKQQGSQDDGESHNQQQQQGLLSPLTPNAGAAGAAAARAASALGSAVATAAAAAGGMIGLAPATPVARASSSADPFAADAGAQGFDYSTGLNVVPGSRSSSNPAATSRPLASGLLERLLGGTVPAADAPFGRKGSGLGLQTQGSGMRHVSSAPDVSALAGLDDVAGSEGSAYGSAGSRQDSLGDDAEAVGAGSGSGSGSGSGGGGAKVEVSAGGSRRARRGSCPYFSMEGSPVALQELQQAQDVDMQQQQQQDAAQQQSKQSLFTQQQQQEPLQQQREPVQQQAVAAALPPPHQQDQQAASPAAQPQQPQQSAQQPHRRQSSAEVNSAPAAAASAGSGAHAARRSDWGLEPRPYNLRVVSHSLGGMLLLIYCTQRARAGRPHHISRLILLSPAGFHPIIPGMFKPLVYTWRPLMLWMHLVWRQKGFPVQLPTFVARMLAFKLSIDTSKLPAVGDLLRSMARLLLGGDRSAWDRALLMPHYTAAGMPLLSSRQVLHFIQLYLTGRCQLYDHGSEAANVAAYQQRTPPIVSDSYHMLRDVPVHLVAGEHDGVIPASNIRHHYAAMRAAGMDVSYREFDYGHMDFTFSAKEELGWYVMSLLMRT